MGSLFLWRIRIQEYTFWASARYFYGFCIMGSICISYKADVSNKFFNQTERMSSKEKDSLQGKQITLYDMETCAFVKSGKIIDSSYISVDYRMINFPVESNAVYNLSKMK